MLVRGRELGALDVEVDGLLRFQNRNQLVMAPQVPVCNRSLRLLGDEASLLNELVSLGQ